MKHTTHTATEPLTTNPHFARALSIALDLADQHDPSRELVAVVDIDSGEMALAPWRALLPRYRSDARRAVRLGRRLHRGRAYLVVTMAAAAAAVVADLLVRKRALAPFLGLVALSAAIAGALIAGLFFDDIGGWVAVGVAAGAGSLSWSWRRVLALQPAMIGARGQIASGVGSVLLVGVVVHIFTVVS